MPSASWSSKSEICHVPCFLFASLKAVALFPLFFTQLWVFPLPWGNRVDWSHFIPQKGTKFRWICDFIRVLAKSWGCQGCCCWCLCLTSHPLEQKPGFGGNVGNENTIQEEWTLKRAAGWWEFMHWWWELYLCLNCSWRLLEIQHGVLESTNRECEDEKCQRGISAWLKKKTTPSLSPVQVCHYAEILLCTIKIQAVLLKAELPFNGIRQYSKKTGAEMNIISNRNHYHSKQRNLFKYRKSRIDRGRKGEKCNYIGKNSSIRELVRLEFMFCPWIKTWAWPITKLKSPLPCSYVKYSFIFQGALLIWGGRCVCVCVA